MLTRRQFAAVAAGARMLPEMAYAQRAAFRGEIGKDMVWLNANENPAGPPPASIRAMTEVLPRAWRYHYQEFGDFYATVAASEGLARDQVLVGAGSSEVLHAAIDAFTAKRPLITMHPTFEGRGEVMRGYGRQVIRTPLTAGHYADVRRMVEEARKAGGGLLYLCNPNNPTAALTPRAEVAWLVENLPANTIALIDEAYIHFAPKPEEESALRHVREGREIIVARTFSKIYGMAGLRAGFACARPDLIRQMGAFRNNVISIVAVRAVLAALAEKGRILDERRAAYFQVRDSLCAWLREREVPYIPPHANFIMIDVGRPVYDFIPAMGRQGVAPGRPFPPLDTMLRVSIGTEQDMQRFREVFWQVYKA